MKAYLLFPRYFRPIGVVLIALGLLLSYLYLFQLPWILSLAPKLAQTIDIADTFIYTGNMAFMLVGLLFMAFSKIKTEDELTAYIRLNSLYWAILVNYLVWFMVTCVTIAVKDGDYYLVKALYPFNTGHVNLIMPLIIFTLRFYYLLNKNK